jgi:hypothetical protein
MERGKSVDTIRQRDGGRISAVLAGGVCFLGLSALYYIDRKIEDTRPTFGTVPTEVSSTDSPASLDARITVPTFSPEDQAILDALAEHHASTVGSVAPESTTETGVEEVPPTTHETHDTETSVLASSSSVAVASETTHVHVSEETIPAQPATGTTVAHSNHTTTETTVASPVSPGTTHGSGHEVTTVPTTVGHGPETVPSLPPQTVTIPPPAG